MRTRTVLTLTGLIAGLTGACSSAEVERPISFGSGSGPSRGGSGGAGGQGSGVGATNPGSGGGSIITFGGAMSGGGVTGGGGHEGCTKTSQTTTPLPPVLEFLIDTSGSMNETPKNATASKWVVTRNALTQAFTNMQEGTGTGLIYYPNRGSGGSCIRKQEAVRVSLLDAMVRQQLLTALANGTTNGGTPTHDAYVYALETLKLSPLTGDKYVVLVTDGAPTYSLDCIGNGKAEVDNAPLIAEAGKAAADGIKTFVIGSPGSESSREALSAIATQGGTAPPGCSNTGPTYCHFDMTTVADLSAALNDALSKITGSVISCNYKIPPPPAGMQIDYTKVNVDFTSGAGTVTPIGKDPDDTACNNGWQYSADKSQIQLCPDSCDLVKADPGAQVDIVLGCDTVVL